MVSNAKLSLKEGTIQLFLTSEKREDEFLFEIALTDTTFLDGEKEGVSSVLRFLSTADLIALRDWLSNAIDQVDRVKHASRFKLP